MRKYCVQRSPLLNLLAYLWASPTTSLGLAVGVCGLATRGKCRTRDGVLEFHGGIVSWLLGCTPVDAIAMTLGHVVLGRSLTALDISHEHELVHVRQCERWGPFFLPAYLACSAYLWLRRKDPYRDNPFEREAFGKSS